MQLSGRPQDRQRDRQIEARAFLPTLGRCQVDGHAAQRELEARIPDGGSDPLFGLLHRGIGEADDREMREAVRDVDLDRDERGLEAPEGAPQRFRDSAHGADPSVQRPSGRWDP